MGNKQETSVIGGHQWIKCRILGKGSFGKVYAMQHSRDSKIIRVVKEMSKSQILDKGEAVFDLTMKEKGLLADLVGCPFVVKTWGTTQDVKHLYMMLDYCSGGELQFHLNNLPGKKMTEAQAKFYFVEVAIALNHMHQKKRIVHRDIKPENVLLDAEGHVALIDFNIAERCNEKLFISNPKGHHVGTAPYMAPELLEGDDHGAAVDYWSLGVMLYEITQGELPFKLKDPNKRTHQMHIKAIHETDIATSFKGSKELLALLTGILEIEPMKRWDAKKVEGAAWLADIDWASAQNKGLKPPIVPDASQVNFSQDLNMEDSLGMTKVKERALSPEEQEKFSSWDWAVENQELNPEWVYVAKEKKNKKDKVAKSGSQDKIQQKQKCFFRRIRIWIPQGRKKKSPQKTWPRKTPQKK